MDHTVNAPVFAIGTIVNTCRGECMVDAYLGIRDGRPTYRLISATVHSVQGYLVNAWIAQIIPTLTITGVDPKRPPKKVDLA